MRDTGWLESEPLRPPDVNKGMRRLAQAVILQAVKDFQSGDCDLQSSAEQFLYPASNRAEDLRWTVELSAVGEVWLEKRLKRLSQQPRPVAKPETSAAVENQAVA